MDDRLARAGGLAALERPRGPDARTDDAAAGAANGRTVSMTALAVTFDGSNDYLDRGAPLTGIADSPTGVFSVWFKGGLQVASVPAIWVTDSSQHAMLEPPSVNSVDPDAVRLLLSSAGFAQEFIATFSCPDIADGNWHHLAISWKTDLAAGSKLASCSFDGVSISPAVIDADAAFSVRLVSSTDFVIAAQDDFDPLFAGHLGEFFWTTGTYLDLTDADNRAKFFDGGLPAYLDEDGSTPLGAPPLVYLAVRSNDAAAAFGANRGTGGDFTIAGALELTDLPVPPPDRRRVIALVATPFDDSIAQSIQGPPWPIGALEAVFGGLEEFSIAGGETAVYASDIGYRSKRSDNPALTWFPPKLAVSLNYSLDLFAGFEPEAQLILSGGGNIQLIDEKGDLDDWLALAFDGRQVRLHRGEKGAAFSSFTRIFLGAADGIEATDRGKIIRLRDRRAPFTRLLQTNLYGGTGGLDGDAGVANQPKPLGWGLPRNATGRVIDSTNLVIQLHDGAIQGVVAVRDKGVALTPTADHPTLAALLGASLSPGQFATCLAFGLIRLGGSAAGTVTVDFQGGLAPDGSYPQRTGAILSLIATTRLGEESFSAADLAGFTALDAAQPAIVQRYYDQAGVTVGQALGEIAYGVGANIWATPDGMLRVKRLEPPSGPPDHVIAKRNIGEAGVRLVSSIPTSRRRVGYDRMWLVQTPDQLHEELLDTDRQLYGNEYRWATAQSPSVPYRHKLATENDHRAFFAAEADAIDEVVRLQGLYGVARRKLSVPVVGIDPFSIRVGETVSLEGYDRLGLDPAGSLWNVVGVTAVLSQTETRLVLTLWR